MRIGIIGGGISGLTLAYFLQKQGIPYDLFEKSEHTGGCIRTLRIDNNLLELGPNALPHTEELNELILDLKLENEIIEANPENNLQYIFKKGQLLALPSSPLDLLTNSFFSWKTKLRLMNEIRVPAADNDLETVKQFFERRFGSEAFSYFIEPLATRFFSGAADQLLVNECFPELKTMEQKYGSVLKGLMKNSDILKQETLFSFKDGLQTLPDAIASKLIALHTGTGVDMITRSRGKYILSTNQPSEFTGNEYDAIVLSLPAHKAADRLLYTAPGLSAALMNINYVPVTVVHTVYPKEQVQYELKGYGAMHPKIEKLFSLGSIWNSSVFTGRTGKENVLFTTFAGGGCQPKHALQPKDELLDNINRELRQLYSITSEKPVFQHCTLWKNAYPQYDMYIQDAHLLLPELENENIFVAANWFGGVSVNSCIRNAKALAQKIYTKANRA